MGERGQGVSGTRTTPATWWRLEIVHVVAVVGFVEGHGGTVALAIEVVVIGITPVACAIVEIEITRRRQVAGGV